MIEERRVCIIVCKKMGRNYRFAVLKRTKNWEGWELVKGHIDEGNTAEQSVYNELSEETGISQDDILRIEPLEYTLEWEYERDGKNHHTTCDCFLVEVSQDVFIHVDQNPHDEHEKGHFLNFRDARDILTHKNQRDLLEYAQKQLK